jgi:hypothetical protein
VESVAEETEKIVGETGKIVGETEESVSRVLAVGKLCPCSLQGRTLGFSQISTAFSLGITQVV